MKHIKFFFFIALAFSFSFLVRAASAEKSSGGATSPQDDRYACGSMSDESCEATGPFQPEGTFSCRYQERKFIPCGNGASSCEDSRINVMSCPTTTTTREGCRPNPTTDDHGQPVRACTKIPKCQCICMKDGQELAGDVKLEPSPNCEELETRLNKNGCLGYSATQIQRSVNGRPGAAPMSNVPPPSSGQYECTSYKKAHLTEPYNPVIDKFGM